MTSYAIFPDEPVAAATRRIVLALLDDAISRGESGDVDVAAHEIRKRCKEGRALLRLLRGSAPFRRDANRWLRDAARLLAPVRERAALHEAVDKLAAATQLEEHVEAGLRKRVAAMTATDLSASELFHEAVGRLRELREQVSTWELTDDGFEAIAHGLRREERRNRTRMEGAVEDFTAEAFHEWRKRAKDARYHTALLLEIAPDLAQRHADLEHLSDLLGDHHDASELLASLDEIEPDTAPDDRSEQRRALEARIAQLAHEALVLGRQLFAGDARDRVDDLERRWREGRAVG